MKNRGFTLVEVMVAAAIAGGLALVIGTLTKQSNQASVKMQSDIDATAIANEVMGHLADPLVCQHANNLGGKSIASLPGTIASIVTQIRKRDANNIYPTGTALAGPFYGSSNLAIKSYTLDDPTAGSADGVNSAGSPRDMYLTIHFFKKQINQNAGNNAEIIRKIKIVFQTNASDTGTSIAFCKAVSTGYDGVWQRGTGGNVNDINYMGGNVGIGTATPTQLLSLEAGDLLLNNTVVDGANIRLKNSANNTWLMDAVDATNSRFRLFTEGGTSGNQERLTALENGRIGIGTAAPNTRLEVSDAAGARIRAGGALNAGFELNDVNTRIDIPAANTMALYTSNAERLRIDSSGRVGIGITNPTVPLHVNGNVIMGARLETGLGVAGGTSEIELGQHRTGNGSSYLDFHSSPGSDYDFRILRNSGVNGNVDIVNVGTGQIDMTTYSNINLTASTTGAVTVNYPGMHTDGLVNDLVGRENHVATKRYVREQVGRIFNEIDPSLVASIASTVATYASSNTMNVIRANVCSILRTRAGGIDYSYTWNGVTCTSTNIPVPPDCSQAGKCTNVYAINHVYAGGNMYASGGFCPGGGGCLTRADRLRCPNGYFMYGIAYGFPQCKYTGVVSPTANWHTTGPYAY